MSQDDRMTRDERPDVRIMRVESDSSSGTPLLMGLIIALIVLGAFYLGARPYWAPERESAAPLTTIIVPSSASVPDAVAPAPAMAPKPAPVPVPAPVK